MKTLGLFSLSVNGISEELLKEKSLCEILVPLVSARHVQPPSEHETRHRGCEEKRECTTTTVELCLERSEEGSWETELRKNELYESRKTKIAKKDGGISPALFHPPPVLHFSMINMVVHACRRRKR